MAKVKNIVIFFSNGTTDVFSIHGQPIEGLRVPWIELYFKFLEEKGIDILKQGFTFRMPNGREVVPIRTPEGWTWRIK